MDALLCSALVYSLSLASSSPSLVTLAEGCVRWYVYVLAGWLRAERTCGLGLA